MTMSPNVPLQTTTATQISKEYLPTYQAKMTLWAEPSITSIPLTSTPTISIEIKETNIAEVIDQNFDCQFPCLFGVEPGVTNWENAANYFSQHSQFIQEDEYRSTFYFENMGIVFHIENESGFVG